MATTPASNVSSAYGSGGAPPPPTPLLPTVLGGISSAIGAINLGSQAIIGIWNQAVTTAIKGLAKLFPTATVQQLLPMAESEVAQKSPGLFAAVSFLQSPVFQYVVGGIGVALGAYSLSQGTVGVYKNGITAGGAINMALGAFGVATGVNSLLGAAALSNPAGWLAAASVITASLAYSGINDLITNGLSAGALATTLASTYLLAGFAEAFAEIVGLAIPGFGLMVAGAVVLFSVLWSIFNPPDLYKVAADKAVQQAISVVWSVAGPTVLVGVGTAALFMGWPRGVPPGVTSTITRPAWQLNQILAGTTGRTLPPQGVTSPTVLVQPGQGSSPTNVMIVTPAGTDSHGQALQNIYTYTLPNSLGIQSMYDPSQGYIPFFKMVNGVPQPNQDALDALMKQNSTLKAALSGYTTPLDALRILAIAAATNKYGATPIGLN